MTALGMPPDIIDQFLVPAEEQEGITSENDADVPTAYPEMLERSTELYVDCYLAVRVLGMRYAEYMTLPTTERLLYRFFVWMESAKERHADAMRQTRREATEEAIQQRPHPRAVRR